MSSEEQIEKLGAWIEANPEAADEPYMNLSTGIETTIRNLYSMALASLAGEAQLDANYQEEVHRVVEWIEEV